MKKLMYLVPTDQVISKVVGAKDNRRELHFQICDLHLPHKRNPVDYEYNVEEAPQLRAGERYYLDQSRGFSTNQYGSLELNKYQINWCTEEELLAGM